MAQEKLVEETDKFIENLNLTPNKIKENLESVKNIEGFPKGEMEDILELSNPPYYTAYPNPYLKDFIKFYGTPYNEEADEYNVEPFVGDISEGKNDKLYSLHSYHTKVPYKSIEHYIKHYTNKGDLILDGFSGTGQTGLAAEISDRNAIIIDLGVAPSFISMNYNFNHNLNELKVVFEQIINKIKKEYGWMYDFADSEINFTVWSDIRTCKFCDNEFNVWKTAIKENGNKFPKTFQCPHCKSEISMKDSKVKLNKNNERTYAPVIVNVFEGKKRKFKEIDENFNRIIEKINNINIPTWYPSYKMMFSDNEIWGDRCIKQDCPGVKTINQLYFKRPLIILSSYFDECRKITDKNIKNSLIFIGTASLVRLTKLNRYISNYKTNVGPYSGTLYMSPFIAEMNAIKGLERKFKDLMRVDFPKKYGKTIISTQSSTDLSNIPDNVIDYIFIDPPFGWNLMYSELNFNWESWLKVFTNNTDETIVSKYQNKNNQDYGILMQKSLNEFFRVLKPERWITIEFHNSSAKIWNLIQKAIVNAGFIIGQVNVLDKKKGTINQAFLENSVKNDLVINAYKPSSAFITNFLKKSGKNMELEFVKQHLEKISLEFNQERTQQMIYSKLLAVYIQNNFEINLNASEFYSLLKENFKEINGYWFNKDQIINEEKITNLNNIKEMNGQNVLGIYDEKSAIIWLYHYLKKEKQYNEIYTDFVKNIQTSLDKIPDLKEILEENFINENGKFRLPTTFEQKTIDKTRNNNLSKEFNSILDEINSSKKKIKEVRKEALSYGLMKLYEEKDVDLIKTIGNRIDRKIIDSDNDISTIIDWAMYK